jgi:hypothetical protein
VEEKLDEIRERILQMNPAQRNIQLDAISRLLDVSGTVVDIKLPKKAPQGRGRPKGASNKAKSHKSTTGATFKPKSTASTTNNAKSTTRDPSAFEYVEKEKEGSSDCSEDQKQKKKEKKNSRNKMKQKRKKLRIK